MLKRAIFEYPDLLPLGAKAHPSVKLIEKPLHVTIGFHQIFWIYSHRAEHFICSICRDKSLNDRFRTFEIDMA